MAKITLFAQILQHLPKDDIKKNICKHGMDKHSKGCDTWTHLVSMIFCQFADCVSLRDIAAGMQSASGNLNHLGVEEALSKSTLGYQNKNRGSDVFRDIYYTIYSRGMLSIPTTFMVPYRVSLDHGIHSCRPLLSFSQVVLVELKIGKPHSVGFRGINFMTQV